MAMERTSASHHKVNRAAVVITDSDVVIASEQGGIAVSSIFGSILVALAVRLTFRYYHMYNITYSLIIMMIGKQS